MDDDRIPFKRLVNKVGADAADIADPLEVLPILDDTHLAAHVALFGHLIEYVHIAESVLRLRCLVNGIHDRNRSLLSDLRFNSLAGQNTDIGILLSSALRNRIILGIILCGSCLRRCSCRICDSCCGKTRTRKSHTNSHKK